jgi:quinol monooxygenase YgiN
VVAEDFEDEDALGVTELWEDQARHRASLSLPSAQAAIDKGRPLWPEAISGGSRCHESR